VNIQRDKALQQRQITFSASELFDLYQSGKDAGGCPGRHGFTTTYALWEEIAILHHVHYITDGMHRAMGRSLRFLSCVSDSVCTQQDPQHRGP
jgi:hypothetical protein